MHVSLPPWSSLIVIALCSSAAVAVLAALLWLLREHATKILCVIFVTLIGLTLVPRQSQLASDRQRAALRRPAAANAAAPLLIHLLLDEHIGVEGLPPEIPAARALRAELIEFYTSRGFRLFGGAYSQYANTFNSIANLLNFAVARGQSSVPAARLEEAEWDLKEAAYFQLLQQRGYRLHVYQSSLHGPVPCGRRAAAGLHDVSGQEPADAAGTAPARRREGACDCERNRHAVESPARREQSLRARSSAARCCAIGLAGCRRGAGNRRCSVRCPCPTCSIDSSDDVLRHPRGHAFFAHLLLPHYPYVFDRRCELRPRTSDWLTNRIASTDALVYNTADSRAQKYERYAEQIRCVLTLLDGLLTSSRAAACSRRHDHRQRRSWLADSRAFPTGTDVASGVLTDSDYRDTFSTLYAISAPGVSPRLRRRLRGRWSNCSNHHLGGEPLRSQAVVGCSCSKRDGGASHGGRAEILRTVESRSRTTTRRLE